MKKKLLLFVLLLAGLTSAHAQGDAPLTVTNVRNTLPGYTGSFDISLSLPDTYRDFIFILELPEGLTYKSYAAGALLDGHTITVTNVGTSSIMVSGHSFVGKTLKANTGTLLTIYYDVSNTASGELSGGLVHAICLSDDEATSHPLVNDDHSFSVPVGNTVTFTDDDGGAPAAIDNVNVTVSRTLTADKWNTICLPFAMTAEQVVAAFGTDAMLGDFAGYTVNEGNIRVSFVTATAIEANHPYLLKVTDNKNGFTVEGVNIVASATPPMVNFGEDTSDDHIKAMVGVYEETTLPAYRLYIKDNTFKYSKGTSKLKPYRAYFHFCDFNADSSARTFTLDDEFTTSIGEAIRLNGIETDNSPEGLYDLNGRKLSGKPTHKGVYIQDGNKVIMK